MIEQNAIEIQAAAKELTLSKIKRGQFLERAGDSRQALRLWLNGLRESQSMVEECRAHIVQHSLKSSAGGNNPQEADGVDGGESASDSEDDTKEKDDDGGDREIKPTTHRQRLRTALGLEHMSTFFAANAYYQIKTNVELTEPGSVEFQEMEKLEEEFYEKARQIRKEVRSALATCGVLRLTSLAAVGYPEEDFEIHRRSRSESSCAILCDNP